MKKANILASIVLMTFTGFYVYLILQLPKRNLPNTLGSEFMPLLLAGILFFLSILLLIRTIAGKFSEKFDPNISMREGSGVIILTIFVYVYVKAIQFFGFIYITPIFLAFLMLISRSRKWKEIVLVSILSSFCIYLFFQKIFRVLLPGGTFF